MFKRNVVATAAISAMALILSACVSQEPSPGPQFASAAPTLRQSISERTLLTVADDLAFPSGGYVLSREGQADLDHIVPDLRALQNGKVVVYGYTDDVPVGPEMRRKGIADNLDLSSKRANSVVRYLQSRGVDPNIMSAKGRGETHPIAANDSPQGRAQNRRIEVVVEQPTL
jgi:chemotaxis protein MotB